jgi:hypothetical protein
MAVMIFSLLTCICVTPVDRIDLIADGYSPEQRLLKLDFNSIEGTQESGFTLEHKAKVSRLHRASRDMRDMQHVSCHGRLRCNGAGTLMWRMLQEAE